MRSSRCNSCWAVVALALFAKTLPAQNQTNGALQLEAGVAAHAQIDAIYQRFSVAYKTLDPAMVANLYTEDALYLPPGSGILRGSQKIQESFALFFNWAKSNKRHLEISFHIVSRQVAEPLAYDVGVYTLKNFENGKEVSNDRGKFVVVARKAGDGSWRFQVDGYSEMK